MTINKRTVQQRLRDAELAGLSIMYAIPSDVYENGDGYARMSLDVTTFAYEPGDRPVVLVPSAVTDDPVGQSGLYARSNGRSLVREFGSALFRVGYSHGEGLAVFPHSVSDEVWQAVIGLIDYVIFDESDLSELESEEIAESFGSFAFRDWYRNDSGVWADVADMFSESEIEAAFWDVEQDHSRDEVTHDGTDVLWLDDAFHVRMVKALTALVAGLFPTPDDDELPLSDAVCRHVWVAGMMHVDDEDVDTVAAMRTVTCESCDVDYVRQ